MWKASFYEPAGVGFGKKFRISSQINGAIDCSAELTIDKEVEASVLENRFIKIGDEILKVTSVVLIKPHLRWNEN